MTTTQQFSLDADQQSVSRRRSRRNVAFNPLAPVTLVLAVLLTWFAVDHHVYTGSVVTRAILTAVVAAVLVSVFVYCIVTPTRWKTALAAVVAVIGTWLVHDYHKTVLTSHVGETVLVTLGFLALVALSAVIYEMQPRRR